MESTNEVLWEAKVRKMDVGNMSDEEVKALQLELTNAVRRITWDYGVHN
jgi:hypothetical protein